MNDKPDNQSLLKTLSLGVFLWVVGGLLFWLIELVFVLIGLPDSGDYKLLRDGMSAVATAKVILRPEKMALGLVSYALVSFWGGMISSCLVYFICRRPEQNRVLSLIGSLFISFSFFLFCWFWLNSRLLSGHFGFKGVLVIFFLILAGLTLAYLSFRGFGTGEVQTIFKRFVAFALALDFFIFGESLFFRHFSVGITSMQGLLGTIGIAIGALGLLALVKLVFRLKPFRSLALGDLKKWVLPTCLALIALAGLVLIIGEGRINLSRVYQEKPKFRGPNIVFIVMDTVRADHLSCYRYRKRTTPYIDQIAREGIVFRNVVSPSSWTLPSHASMFTGLFPFEHGASYNFSYLPKEFETLAEILKAQGYKTLAYSNNPWVSFLTGLHRGFDDFQEGWRRKRSERYFYQTIFNSFINFYKRNDPAWAVRDHGAAKTNRYVTRWIKEHRKDPFFVFINFMEAHLPYEPPLPYAKKFLAADFNEKAIKRYSPNVEDIRTMIEKRGRSLEELAVINGLYDGEINYLDEKIGELFQQFKDLNLADETLFIITSDHGENLGEHGLVGHAYGLYDTLLKVPLILRYPQYFKSGLEIEENIQTTDIFYTILDAVSVERSPSKLNLGKSLGRRMKARDWQKILLAEHDKPNHVLRSAKEGGVDAEHVNKDLSAIISRGFKYIQSSKREEELFDLKTDPNESHSLVSERKEISAALESKLGEIYKTDRAKAAGGKKIQMDKETESKLRSLGYIK